MSKKNKTKSKKDLAKKIDPQVDVQNVDVLVDVIEDVKVDVKPEIFVLNPYTGGQKGHNRISESIPQSVTSYSNNSATQQSITALVVALYLMKCKVEDLGVSFLQFLGNCLTLELSGQQSKSNTLLFDIGVTPTEIDNFVYDEIGVSFVKKAKHLYGGNCNSPLHIGGNRNCKPETRQTKEKKNGESSTLSDTFAYGAREVLRKAGGHLNFKSDSARYLANPQFLNPDYCNQQVESGIAKRVDIDRIVNIYNNVDYIDAKQQAHRLLKISNQYQS